MSIKKLSLSQVESSGLRGSLWLINSAAQSELELSGNILISIPRPNGKVERLEIPETWLPMDASTKFPKERLLDSSEFRSAVQSELITLIDEETAQRILSRAGAADERRRLSQEASRVKKAGAARNISDSNVEIIGIDSDDENVKKAARADNVAVLAANGVDLDEDGFRPAFKMFVEKIKNQNDITALNAIRTRARFSLKELRYIRDYLPNHPQTVKEVKSMIREKKAEIAAKKAK